VDASLGNSMLGIHEYSRCLIYEVDDRTEV
jgi:hypothetical protein